MEDDSGDVPPTPLKLKCLPRRYARVASPPRCASPKYGGNRRHHHRRKYSNVSNISKEQSINSKSIHAENIAWYIDISRYDTENKLVNVEPQQLFHKVLPRYFRGRGIPRRRDQPECRRISVTFILDYTYCLLYTSPSPRDATLSRMPSSA